jgi:hypothetical protein
MIAEILRKDGFDAVSAYEAETGSWDDERLLEEAARIGRCFVTRNRDDFIRLTVSFFEDLRPHCGVVIVPHSYASDAFSSIADSLAAYAGSHPEGRLAHACVFLPAPQISTRRKRKK